MDLRARLLACALAIWCAMPPAVADECPAPHATDTSRPDRDAALRISQSALGRSVGNHKFRTATGQSVRLSQFRGKPLVVSFVYTSCHHTCPMLTNHLARVTGIAREALGVDSFSVLTVGFDVPNDTPARMRQFAEERRINLAGWWFVSGDRANVDALARDLGFVFYPSPKGFDHLAQTTVIDAEGKVYRQVYGEAFSPPTLVEPLKELMYGTRKDGSTLTGWLNGLRLFCTVYDPASGRYRFDYSVLVAVLAGVTGLGAVALFIVRAWRHRPPASVA